MNAYWIGVVIGSVVFAFLWSRLWLWLTKRAVKMEPRRLFVAYAIAWSSAVMLGALGFSDGGGPNWVRALATYTPSLALWLAIDLLARRGRASVGDQGMAR